MVTINRHRFENRTAVVMLVAVIFISFIATVSAQIINDPTAQQIASSGITLTQDKQLTWIDKLFQSFSSNVEDFSIVGRDSGNSVNADKTWTQPGGSTVIYYASSECTSGHGLFDVYTKTSGSTSYVPRYEMRDGLALTCGTWNTDCKVELYCGPAECQSNSDCSSGKTCVTANAIDNYLPLWTAQGTVDSSYNYCKTTSCTGSPITCWRQGTSPGSSSLSCQSQTYECSNSLYNSIKTNGCSSAVPTWPYASQSQCQGNLPSTCTPSWSCTDYSALCIGDKTFRTCTDNNNCGTTSGIPTLSQYCNGGTIPSCSDGIKNQDETGIDIGGVCGSGTNGGNTGGTTDVTARENERILIGDVQVYDLTYGDSITGKPMDKLIPGQKIDVTFKVKVDGAHVLQSSYLTEAGIIPLTTAQKWGIDKPSSGFNIFNSFVVGESNKDACCLGQTNIADSKMGNLPGFPKLISDTITEFSYTITVPNSISKDLCGSETYWDGNQDYVIYAMVKNGCYKDGYRKFVAISQNVNLEVNASTKVGTVCTADFNCAAGESCVDIKGDFSLKKYCSSDGTLTSGNLSLNGLKKIPLTREDISKATTPMLFASACHDNSECLTPNNNYTVSCVSLNSLIADGTITKSGSASLMDYGKGIVIGSTAGASIGAAVGMYICDGVMVTKEVVQTATVTTATAAAGTAPEIATKTVTVPVELATCALWGGGAGAVLGGVFGSWVISMDKTADPLVKAFNAKDSSSVGICTAEPSTSFDVGAFLTKLGKIVKITGVPATDGIIVLVGGVIVLFIFLNLFRGGKK